MNRFAFSPLLALALTACATNPPPAPAISPEMAAADFSVRSLQDAGLHRFLVTNLGHEPAAWDLETLSWVAFYYHPALAVARAQWVTARAMQESAGLRPNPTISLVPGYNSTREPGRSPWFPAINFDFLLQGDKRARQQDIARADAEVARLGVLTAAWQVRGDLRRALIDWQTASAREAGWRAQDATQTAVARLLRERFEAGRATASETSAARLAAIRSAAALAEVRMHIQSARARLATALGLPVAAIEGHTFAPLPVTNLSGDALAIARRQSLQSRADVFAALAKYHSTEAALALELAKQQPDFHLGPGYQWDQGANKWSLALTFELPIFHRNEGPIGEAVARRGEAAAQFVAIQAQAIAAIDAAVLALAAASEQRQTVLQVRDESSVQAHRAEERVALGAMDKVEQAVVTLEVHAANVALADADSAVALATGQLEDALQIPFPNLLALADPAQPQFARVP